jgi:glycosyltransferase involved in cell wall biosynthesis
VLDLPLISVVIPVREGGDPYITLRSLSRQSYRPIEIIIAHDKKGNANWARNLGAHQAIGSLFLFSDDDIDWHPSAIALLYSALSTHPEASYAYGAYQMEGRIQCNREWDWEALKQRNYISTMSLVKSSAFQKVFGFDQEVHRLQDWDLWIRMGLKGMTGVYCGGLIFRTKMKDGITCFKGKGRPVSEAYRIVRERNGI